MSDEPKVRRVNFSPDEYLAGIAGKLTFDEQGLYWLICTLIYSRGGPIDDDPKWLCRFSLGERPRKVRRLIDSLVAKGKLTPQYDGTKPVLSAQRARTELVLAAQRIRSARVASDYERVRSGKINDLVGQANFGTAARMAQRPMKLSLTTKERTNHQPPVSPPREGDTQNAETQPEVVSAVSPNGAGSGVVGPPNLPAAPPEQPLEVTGALRASRLVRK